MTEQKNKEERNNLAAFQIDKETMRVETLNGFTLMDNGARVFSYHNVPTAADVGAAAYHHDHNDFGAIDNRTVAPSEMKPRKVAPFFTSNSNLGLGNGYSDLLTLNTYSDGSGGKMNALAFSKEKNELFHIQANQGDGSWGTPAKIYTDVNKPTAAEVGAVATTGGNMTGNLGAPNLLLNVNEAQVLNAEGENLVQSTKNFGSVLFGNSNKDTYLESRSNVRVRVGGADHYVYHSGYKPTAADVGAVPSYGGNIADFNDLKSNGIYQFKSNAKNSPNFGDTGSSVNGVVTVVVGNDGSVHQTAVLTQYESQPSTRYFSGNRWSPWTDQETAFVYKTIDSGYVDDCDYIYFPGSYYIHGFTENWPFSYVGGTILQIMGIEGYEGANMAQIAISTEGEFAIRGGEGMVSGPWKSGEVKPTFKPWSKLGKTSAEEILLPRSNTHNTKETKNLVNVVEDLYSRIEQLEAKIKELSGAE